MNKIFTYLKTTAAVTLLLFLCVQSKAQTVNTYAFTQTAGTFTSIGAGTTAMAAGQDDVSGTAQNIGFNFTYEGTVFTQFCVQSNGYIKLGATITQSYTPLSAVTNSIAFMGGDGKTGGAVIYTTSGVSPNRILTVEFPTWNLTWSAAANTITAQIKLYETTNVVQIVYGASAHTAAFSRQVGLRGTLAASFNDRTGSNWAATTAGALNSSVMTWGAATFPASGQTYTWTPPVTYPIDVAGNLFVTPSIAATCANPCATVTVRIKNAGTAPWVATTNPLTINWGVTGSGGAPSSGPFAFVDNTTATALAPNATRDYVVNGCFDMSVAGTYTFNSVGAGVTCTGDLNATNLAIPSIACTIASINTYPYTQGFEAALVPAWFVTQLAGAGNWIVLAGPMVFPTLVAHGGANTAYFNSFNFGSGTTSRLTTPCFDFTTLTNPYVDYWLSHDNSYSLTPLEGVTLRASGDGGATWSAPLQYTMRYDPAVTPFWDKVSVALTAYAGNPNVKLAFDAYGQFGNNIGMDDITVYQSTICSGTPTAGTSSAPSAICSGNNFTVSDVGFTNGPSQITYVWQKDLGCTNTWSDIGVPSASYSDLVTNQTAQTCYRLKVTCTFSGNISYSTVSTVNMNPANFCYCSSAATTTADEEITNVTITGATTLNNTTTCASLGGGSSILNRYNDYTALTPPNLGQATTVNLSVTIGSCGTFNYNSGFAIFIDYNQNGSFADAGEMAYFSPSPLGYTCIPASVVTGTFVVPGSATLGVTGMRVIDAEGYYPGSLITPCLSYGFGETEDYRVNIVPTPPCAGSPAAGTATAAPGSLVCPGTNILLSATGLTNSPGISYIWQANNATLGAWTNLPAGGITVFSGSVTSDIVTVTGQTIATQYRLVTTCSNGGAQTPTNVLSVSQDVATNCYCTPSYVTWGNTDNDYINSVSVNTLNSGITGPNAPPPNYYILMPQTTNFDQGSAYTMNLTGSTIWSEGIRAWIDYNQDGDFYDVGEDLGAVLIAAGGTGAINFTCPNTATLGSTRMRVRDVFSSTTIDPCAVYVYGETEDYNVTITALPTCSGVPTAGTTNTSDPTPCSGIPFTLSVTGSSVGILGSLAEQWQIATAIGGPYVNIAGGTGASLTTTQVGAITRYYRRRLTCTATNDSSFSSILTATTVLCYCQPTYTTGTTGGYYISNVQIEFGSLNNASLGAAVNPAAYTYFNTVTGQVMAGASYWVNVTSGTNAGNHYVGIWADWNGDGDFIDANEAIVGSNYTFPELPVAGNGGVGHAMMTVPAGATIGTTVFRVRTTDQDVYNNFFYYMDPCLSNAPYYLQGETEDYNLQVIANQCFGTSQGGFLSGITPSITVVNDAVTPSLSGNIGTVIAWQYDFTAPYDFLPADGQFTSYTGTVIMSVLQPYVYMRAVVQNGGCPVDYSNSAFTKLNCATPYLNNTAFDDYIANVSLGVGGSLINHNSVPDASLDGYQDFTTGLSVPHLTRGSSYPISLTTGPWGEYSRCWIDENNDGIFSTNESVMTAVGGYIYGAANTPSATTILIPCGTWVGSTPPYSGPVTMRIGCSFGTPPDVDACYNTNYAYGENQEFTVFIDPLPLLTTNPQAAVCQGQTAVLNVSGGSNYQWSPVNGGSGVVMNPPSGAASTVTVQTTSPANVFFTVTGTLASGCTSQNIVPVATTPLAGTVSPTGVVICTNTSTTLNSTGAAGDLEWQWSLDGITWIPAPGINDQYTYSTPNTSLWYAYRLLSKSAACYDISSNTAIVEIAQTPVITFTNVTASSVVVNWTPIGSGSYTATWVGAGTGTNSSATSPLTISGLTANTNLSVTITKNSPNCAGTSAGTGTTKTLCAAPLAPSFGAITATSAVVNIPAGATSYKVFYKLIQISNTYQSSGVLAGGSTYSIIPLVGTTLYPGAALSVYLQAWDCPTVGLSGQAGPPAIQYLSPGTSTCPTPTPFTTNEVTSTCPNRITVALGGNPSNTYRVTFRRLLPTVSAPITYNVTGTSMNYTVLNTPSPQVWEVYAVSTCGPSYGIPYSVMTQVIQVQIKGGCSKINNLVLSHVTCHGLTATWNVGECGVPSTNLLGYTIFVKPGTSQWSGYPSLTNVKSANIFNSGTLIQVYVRANSCNGSFGPASDIQSVTTLSVGCREEEQQTEETLFGDGITNEFGTLNLFPNPNSGQFNIDLQMSNMKAQDVRVEVMNMLGQTVLTQITSINDGHLTESVGMPENITSGSYMVRVIVGDKAIFNSQVNISK